ncbi:hypothetical protein EVG20_g806 [Dentipellis fragilis]|uniref:Uncharacterized protein n=1 Tax=Dentipellis fragilis TaxID=205917 RepID=A0A4Y9ZFH7_9AGAM|nr:hypothetical protein EVG20_g806 [Dentipellis fragilis]
MGQGFDSVVETVHEHHASHGVRETRVRSIRFASHPTTTAEGSHPASVEADIRSTGLALDTDSRSACNGHEHSDIQREVEDADVEKAEATVNVIVFLWVLNSTLYVHVVAGSRYFIYLFLKSSVYWSAVLVFDWSITAQVELWHRLGLVETRAEFALSRCYTLTVGVYSPATLFPSDSLQDHLFELNISWPGLILIPDRTAQERPLMWSLICRVPLVCRGSEDRPLCACRTIEWPSQTPAGAASNAPSPWRYCQSEATAGQSLVSSEHIGETAEVGGDMTGKAKHEKCHPVRGTGYDEQEEDLARDAGTTPREDLRLEREVEGKSEGSGDGEGASEVGGEGAGEKGVLARECQRCCDVHWVGSVELEVSGPERCWKALLTALQLRIL